MRTSVLQSPCSSSCSSSGRVLAPAAAPLAAHVVRTHRTASSLQAAPGAISARPAASAVAAVKARDVRAAFFRFGGENAESAGVVGSQGRDEYIFDDLEQYFNYMGFLAEEGTYDRMEALTNKGLHPIDCILLLAASENDTPKIQEILKAGADVRATDAQGRTASQIATKPEVLEMLKEAESKLSSV